MRRNKFYFTVGMSAVALGVVVLVANNLLTGFFLTDVYSQASTALLPVSLLFLYAGAALLLSSFFQD